MSSNVGVGGGFGARRLNGILDESSVGVKGNTGTGDKSSCGFRTICTTFSGLEGT